jgi:predicted DCC family thiol-disulfide oxidoreductase YuxK
MNTLKNYSLLFDRDCPLCHWYTSTFIKYKMLDENGRIAFQEIDEMDYPSIDFYKATNKIALLNRENGEVVYGVDSLTKVLNYNFPFIGFFMKLKPVYWFFDQLYNFISFNRKIVIPISCSNSSSCNPTRNWFWRSAFMVFCCLVVNVLVGHYFQQHLANYFKGNPIYGDTIYFMVQCVFQYFMCLLFNEKNVYDYLGHVSFVSFLGALFLAFCGQILNSIHYFNINIAMLQPFCYGLVFAWMFMEHRRRILTARMDWRLSYTWLLVRLIMYPFAFTLK